MINPGRNVMNQQDAISTEVKNDEKDDEEVSAAAALREKLIDALIPGFQAEFDPEEAEKAGAFVEDALSELDAAESSLDLDPDPTDATMPVAANDGE
jgi:hypothetical protein